MIDFHLSIVKNSQTHCLIAFWVKKLVISTAVSAENRNTCLTHNILLHNDETFLHGTQAFFYDSLVTTS